MVWPSGHDMLYSIALRAWHGIWFGLASMLWYMVWSGGHRIVYGMAWRASHDTWLWPGRQGIGLGIVYDMA